MTSHSTNVNVSGTGSRQPRDYSGRHTVAGLFTDRADAEQAINDLRAAGFTGDQIGVALRDRSAQNELVEDTGTHAAEGATAGALGGGLLGGLTGFLIGIGALAIPGIGPVVAGGALATAFGVAGGTAVAGAGIGAAAGGIVGGLVGMGIPEDEARHFETGFRSGGTLVTVKAGDRAMDALAILERYGADTGPGSMGSRGGDRGVDVDDTGKGALAGGAAGAATGAVVGGPPGAVVGGAIGAAAGGTGGAVVDATDDEEGWTVDEQGRRVRRKPAA
jgi:hypothetical protein